MDLEFPAKPDLIQIHVRDHAKPVDLKAASARLTLLGGGRKQEVELNPAGDKLEASCSFKPTSGTKAAVVVSLYVVSPLRRGLC